MSDYETKTNTDLDDPGEVFGKHKKGIIFMLIATFSLLVLYILYATGVITLLVMDCIIIPIIVITLLVLMIIRNRTES